MDLQARAAKFALGPRAANDFFEDGELDHLGFGSGERALRICRAATRTSASNSEKSRTDAFLFHIAQIDSRTTPGTIAQHASQNTFGEETRPPQSGVTHGISRGRLTTNSGLLRLTMDFTEINLGQVFHWGREPVEPETDGQLAPGFISD